MSRRFCSKPGCSTCKTGLPLHDPMDDLLEEIRKLREVIEKKVGK